MHFDFVKYNQTKKKTHTKGTYPCIVMWILHHAILDDVVGFFYTFPFLSSTQRKSESVSDIVQKLCHSGMIQTPLCHRVHGGVSSRTHVGSACHV